VPLDRTRPELLHRCGRIAAAGLLGACLATGCYTSHEGPTPWICADDECTGTCRSLGREDGRCSEDHLCICAGAADADADDVEDLPDIPDSLVDVAPPDDASTPDEAEAPEASDAADELPTDVSWTPDGSGAECTIAFTDSCRLPERCDRGVCGPFGTGVCVVPPVECPPWDSPVCGCNRITYGNDCLRMLVGEPREHIGACGTGEDPPLCVIDYLSGAACWTTRVGCVAPARAACCGDCHAECRDDGLETEGWYSACDPSAPADCSDQQILLENCM
jgi:hypothetical protein